ncbi:MAG: hypothetical protein ACR2LM_18705 [Pyrinomonadaceae bacterium]
MARGSKKKASKTKTRAPRPNKPLDPLRAGMPALDSITGVKEMKRGKTVFRIIKTTEVDAYDKLDRPKEKERNK